MLRNWTGWCAGADGRARGLPGGLWSVQCHVSGAPCQPHAVCTGFMRKEGVCALSSLQRRLGAAGGLAAPACHATCYCCSGAQRRAHRR